MGTCWHCNTEVTLSKEQTKCDNCKEVLFYHCNNCKEEFKVEDKEHKLKECKLCGYFYCPHCGVCFYGCKKYKWQDNIMKILALEFSFIKYPILQEKIKKIIDYMENEKSSNERKECINHVPITYAKGRIKSLMAKSAGFRVRNINDKDAFDNRIKELTEMDIGEKTTISAIREEGTYGQEYRDAFNLLVCLGKMKITWIEAKDDKPAYPLFERIDNPICSYLNKEKLIINECKKCKKQFPRGVKFCDICVKKKGKYIGSYFETKERLDNIDTCQMYRGDFE